jgi:hypothetical protein
VLITAASCSDLESAPPVSPTSTASTISLEEMGNDANQYHEGQLVPKIFKCGVECLSPEDYKKYREDNSDLIFLDPGTPEILDNEVPQGEFFLLG